MKKGVSQEVCAVMDHTFRPCEGAQVTPLCLCTDPVDKDYISPFPPWIQPAGEMQLQY